MYHASLHLGLRKHCGYGFRKPLEPVDDGDEHVFGATIFQLVHDTQPKFSAFVLLDPKTENLFGAIGFYAKRDVDGLVPDRPLIANFHSDGVKENQRVERFERSILPFGDFLDHSIRHRADKIRRGVDTIKLAQMSLD